MYSHFGLARKYLHYYLTALNGKGHGMHSPFVFRFIQDVLNNRQGYSPPPEIAALRRQLLRDGRLLHIEDLGAGSRVAPTRERTVAQVAKSAIKPPRLATLLYRLVRQYQPQTIVELGTSLGITTAYLAAANPQATVYTIEGSAAVRGISQENFKALGLSNIQSLQGNFDHQLPLLLEQLPTFDFAYIDGNHRYAPTLDYFHQFLKEAHPNAILVFDDIHWSAEMEQAWSEIKKHPSVRCTVDVFFMGAVFFRPEFREVQHFTVRF